MVASVTEFTCDGNIRGQHASLSQAPEHSRATLDVESGANALSRIVDDARAFNLQTVSLSLSLSLSL